MTLSTPFMSMRLLEIQCKCMEETIESLKDQSLAAHQKDKLHQLVCRLETIATSLRSLQATESPVNLPT